MERKGLPEPKNPRSVSHSNRGGVTQEHRSMLLSNTTKDTQENTHNKHTQVSRDSAPNPLVDTLEMIEAAERRTERDYEKKGRNKNAAARARRRQRAQQKEVFRLTKTEVEELWATAFEEAFERDPGDVLTEKEWGILKMNIKRSPIPDLGEFFADVCNGWAYLRTGPLDWTDVDELPAFKDVAILVRHIRRGLSSLEYRDKLEKEKLIKGTAIKGTATITPVGSQNQTLVCDAAGVPLQTPLQTNERRLVLFDNSVSSVSNRDYDRIPIGSYLFETPVIGHGDLYLYIWCGRMGWSSTGVRVSREVIDDAGDNIFAMIEADF